MVTQSTSFTLVTLKECPHLAEVFLPYVEQVWSGFLAHEIYVPEFEYYTNKVFPELQLYFLNDAQQPVAVGGTIPVVWDGTIENLPIGWGDSLLRGAANYQAGQSPNTLVALDITINPEYQGYGISYRMLKAMRAKAEEYGFQAIIVAVRPTLKASYPLTPMERYMHWQRSDGAPFDPWIRTHWRMGAEILKVADNSMVIKGSVAEWEEWTGLQFPESGDYIVPRALVPVQIDHDLDIGQYIEPNVWMHHLITTKRLRLS